MILTQKSNLIYSTPYKYEEDDRHPRSEPTTVFAGINLKESGANNVERPHCRIGLRQEEDEYQLSINAMVTEDTENSMYTHSLSSSVSDLKHDDVERIDHYVGDASVENDNNHQNKAFQSFCMNNRSQLIDHKFSLKRANPVYDEESESEFEQEQNRHRSKRKKRLGLLSTELCMQDNCSTPSNVNVIITKDIFYTPESSIESI